MPPAAFSTVRLPSVPAESAMPFALVVASMIPEFALTSTVAAAPMPITSAEITPELRVTVTVVAPMATPPVPVPSTRPELSSVTPTPRMPPPLALTVPALVTATFWPLMAMLFTLAPVASMVPELLLTLTVVALMANPSAEMVPDVVMVAVSNTPIAVLLKAVALMVPELDVRVKFRAEIAVMSDEMVPALLTVAELTTEIALPALPAARMVPKLELVTSALSVALIALPLAPVDSMVPELAVRATVCDKTPKAPPEIRLEVATVARWTAEMAAPLAVILPVLASTLIGVRAAHSRAAGAVCLDRARVRQRETSDSRNSVAASRVCADGAGTADVDISPADRDACGGRLDEP